MTIFSLKTLTLSKPSLRGMVYFLLTIPLVLLAAEIAARSPIGNLLPAPSVNADSFLLDAKIYQLEQQLRRDGRLDCLIIGSSVANVDFDPAVIEQTYHEQTGETIRCYNLGLPAMTVETAAAIANTVTARYHPTVIIYAILPRDINDEIADISFIEEADWVKHDQDDPNLAGWLAHHSYAWRYFLTWRYWLVIPNRVKMETETAFLTPKGFQPAQGIREPYIPNLTMKPERLRRTWQDPHNREKLERFLALQEKGVKIVLVEGPAFRKSDGSDAETWQTYDSDYLPTLLDILQTREIPFWRTDGISVQIPAPHWYDWLHLNSQGAAAFSRWFGQQLAGNEWIFK